MIRAFVITIFFLFSPLCRLSAQATLIAAFDFPERVVLNDSEAEFIKYHTDGEWHIVSSRVAGLNKQAIAYNALTGETKNTNYCIEEVFDFGSEKRYYGSRVDRPAGPWSYLRLLPDGTFQTVGNFQAYPQYIVDNKAYGVQHNKVYEMRLVGASIVLFDLPSGVSSNYFDYFLGEGALYLAHPTGLLAYDFGKDSLYAPFDAYFQEHSLRLIPWSGSNGRFLYNQTDALDEFRVHEIGYGIAPRELPQGANPPSFGPRFWSTWTDGSQESVTPLKQFSIANGADITWIGIQRGVDWEEIKSSHLIRIDRQEFSEGVDEMSGYKRSIRTMLRHPALLKGMSTGREVVALGLYGEEGFEPYGYVNGELKVLKDFYEGPMGSVAYANDIHLNLPSRFHRTAEYLGYQWFLANSSYFGMELAISDGTPGGTRLYADLEPGIKGLRAVDFDLADDILHVMVQRDDHSIAIYRIGPNIPSEPEVPSPTNDWEQLYSNMDGNNKEYGLGLTYGRPAIVPNGETLMYLTDRFGKNQNYLQSDLPEGHIGHLFVTMDALTGEVISKKSIDFHDFRAGDGNSFLFPRENGGYTVLRSGYPAYHDDEHSIELPFDYNINYAVFSVNFNSDLEFESIQRIDLGNRDYKRILHATKRKDGNIVVVADPEFNSAPLAIGVMNDAGEVLNFRILQPLRNYMETFEAWMDERGTFYIAQYSTRPDCQDCSLFIHSYDSELQTIDTYEAIYNGALRSPRMYMMNNGERWITGGLRGSITFSGSNVKHTVGGGDIKGYQAFVSREITEINWFLPFRVYDSDILNYQASFLHEGNVFLNYLRGDLNGESYTNIGQMFNFFNPPDQAFYEIVQLDAFASEAQYHVTPVLVRNVDRTFRHTQHVMPDGKWIRAFSGARNNVVHAEFWKHPLPVYHDSFFNRVQMVKTDWPFQPLPVTTLLAEADENGGHMHIFPNPNDGNFMVLPRDGANKIPYDQFRVFDMQGRVVHERTMLQEFSYKQVQLPVSLAQGLYHVVFSGPEVQESLRLVIAR